MAQNTTLEEPAEFNVDVGDISIAYFEWRREKCGAGPTLLMTHATGFHARLWDEIARLLPEFHIVAVDQRGHGRSTGGPVDQWHVFGRDLEAFVRALDLKDIVGVGHSMGGYATIDAASRLKDRFRRLIAIDPVIASPEQYAEGGQMSRKHDEPHPSIKRKRHFSSANEMIERFESRSPYSLFSKQSLSDYCRYGLLPNDQDGGFDLACAPEMEASIYMSSRNSDKIFASVRAVDVPVLIIRGRKEGELGPMNFTSSPTWPDLAHQFANGRDMYFPDHTHFIPMEIPDQVASIIRTEANADQP